MDIRFFLQLNKDKTEILIFGTEAQRQKIAAHHSSLSLESKSEARTLGVLIDSDMKFKSRVNHITKSAFCYRNNISKLKGFCPKQTLKS